ncbi:hypothetical protein [Riemerella anatipestifer]|uniref:Uncharacterized protein n=1 Tax=Riemerella anatipestifer RA-CH-1 TaxID=1228997 RepID=J9QZ89_RIEAN|nr:hypothetical protein [Riemerella anatipestifer]WIL01311.1 hypothetical protein CRP6_000031 [Riemerella phage vB_RanS_CRP6]AFR35955.1 hypothetical protein B739_1357 [Riemerella anatipestifer RA-CH-1]MCO7331098.1 hypothetical protein [Riemerella anatipestifer]MCO7349852.1 hypothetical protein [Riemerella anatipestifer]MCU7583688.1 hypothetical protein [Riemerella anatipestifer]
MKLRGVDRAIEYAKKRPSKYGSNFKIDFLNGYNIAIEDTKAVEMFNALSRILGYENIEQAKKEAKNVLDRLELHGIEKVTLFDSEGNFQQTIDIEKDSFICKPPQIE